MKKALSSMLALLLVICSISCYAYAETSDLDVAARVEELRNDPVIQEMVERYAPDPKEWWDWYEKLPLEASTGVSKFYILDWLEYFASMSEEDRLFVNYNPLYFAVTEPDAASEFMDDYATSSYAVVDPPAGGGCLPTGGYGMIMTKICGTILYVKKLIATLMR